MRPPLMMGGKAGTNCQPPSAIVVGTGLVEDDRKRGRGQKERCAHWDQIEINGGQTIMQRADTSTVAPSALSSALSDMAQDRRKPGPPEEPSHLVVPTERTMCNMCLATTESSSMSEARRQWDVANSSERGKVSSASYLYDSAKLCTLCSQFFCSNKGEGQSDSPVTLESMASNEPLPESTVKPTATAPRKGKVMEQKRKHPQKHDAIEPAGGSRSSFPLDELIADDDEGLIVKEVDLARLLGATAVQSSTADCMEAGVCVGHSIMNIMRGGEAEGGMGDITVRGTVRPTTSRYDDSPVNTPTAFTEWNGNSIAPPGTILDPTRVQSASTVTVTVEGDRSMIADSKARRSTSVVAPVTATAFQASTAFLSPRMSPQESIVTTARTCSRTRREAHPWWELNLGNVFPVRCIRVTHPDRRMEGKKAGALPFVDVAPFWIMVTAGFIGECTPEKARELAVQSKRWGSHGKMTVWELGVNCFATGVRIQAEGMRSLQLHRVEVIKGGGTQQAMDAAQHRYIAADRAPSALLPRGGGTDGGSSCPQESSPVSPTEAEDGRATNSSKSRRVSEHTMTLRRLERFYRGLRSQSVSELFGQEEPAEPSHAVMSGATTVSAVGDGNGGTAELPEADMYSGDLGNVRPINPATNAFYSRATTSVGAGDLTRAMKRESKASGLLRSRPTTGGRLSLRSHRRWSQSDQRVPSRQRKKTNSSGRREDVQRLLLRAMVGYDWVDDFNGRERRLRGVFTERDVGILEEIYLRCALGDEAEGRATASVSDQSIELDPGELCLDLRRIQLQVQTNSGKKSKKTPMLLAILDSFHLLQLFSSGVVESLPDALARVEARLPTARRPLRLNWTQFLGMMDLCRTVAEHRGEGVAVSAVARLFQDIRDDKLDFLTRKRSHLLPASGGEMAGKAESLGLPLGATGSGDSKRREDLPSRQTATAPTGLPVSETQTIISIDTRSGGVTPSSLNEGGGAFSMKREAVAVATASLGGERNDRTRFREVSDEATLLDSPARQHQHYEQPQKQRRDMPRPATTATHVGSWQRKRGTGGGGRGGGGRSAALKSLLRPQARHDVSRGYSGVVSKRRQRQREALRRAPKAKPEPTRTYRSCGVCRVPFPVKSLPAVTASRRAIGIFLASAGATPRERVKVSRDSMRGLQRLQLCIFCAQFFDPNIPGGVIPPDGDKEKYRDNNELYRREEEDIVDRRRPATTASTSRNHMSNQNTSRLIPFFDDRFPDRWSGG